MSEQRLSADGLYYWNGKEWVTTISPDGRSRWDGTRWIPLPAAAPAPMYAPMPVAVPRRPPRAPTSWTRPMQYAIAAVFAIYALYTLSTPLWLGGSMDAYARHIAIQQAEQAPQLYPDPNQYADMMVSVIKAGFVASAIIALAVAVVVIIGAFRRWVWLFYVVLALFGFSALGLPFQVANVAGQLPHNSDLALPAAASWASIGFGVAAIALGAWMLIALITRGPWAMRRPSALQ